MVIESNSPISIFPLSTTVGPDGSLQIAGHSIRQLVEQFGTPLYLYDGKTVTHQMTALQQAFASRYAGEALIAYAGKAYLALGIAAKMVQLGAGVDVVSLGEMRIAQKAGFDPGVVHLHGNNKSEAELQAAMDWGIQAIVVDSLDELAFLESLAAHNSKKARIWLRITPDLAVKTHPHIETSHSGSKFGLHIINGQAAEAIQRAKASLWLHLVGLHAHLGSQIFDPLPYRRTIEVLYALAEAQEFVPEELSPGGGWGVRYTPEDPSDDSVPWVSAVTQTVQEECAKRRWPLPRLVLEPGRHLVARAGVAIYSVGTQKDTPDGLHIIALDGGMSDNPRGALYGARYTALVVDHPFGESRQNSRLVGKLCESGDVLIQEIPLPQVSRHDLIAIPASGAYQLSMSSNYNLATRPAVLWLEPGSVEVLQPREHPENSRWWTAEG